MMNHKVKQIVLVLNLLMFTSLACSMAPLIQRRANRESDSLLEEVPLPGEIYEEVMRDEDCPGTSEEFESFWENQIYPDLIFSNRNCSPAEVTDYKYCMRSHMIDDECYGDAVFKCEAYWNAIPTTLGLNGIQGQASMDVTHSEAENVDAIISFDSGGGPVEGSLSYVLKDSHLCTIKISGTFQGSFDSASCGMNGNGELKYVYDGQACASICGSGPNSETECPVTVSGGTNWQAEVIRDYDNEIWLIQGGIGCGDNNAPGCVGFLAEVK
jgi:hypothetical protein